MPGFSEQYNDSTLKTYKYPIFILEYIRKIVKFIDSSVSPESIILIGSASRGELVYDEINVYSDFEFYVVVSKGLTKKQEKQYLEKLNTLKATLQNNIYTDIDISLISGRFFKNQRNRLITFDTKETGITLLGKCQLSQLPQINVQNIEQGDVDEILLFRLVDIYVNAKKGDKEFKECLLKNLLYILTWSLIQDGVLISGFKNRVQYYNNSQVSLGVTNQIFAGVDYLIFESLNFRLSKGRVSASLELNEIFKVYSRAVKLLILKNGFECDNLQNKLRQIKYSISLANAIKKNKRYDFYWIYFDKRLLIVKLIFSYLKAKVDGSSNEIERIFEQLGIKKSLRVNKNDAECLDLILQNYFPNLKGKVA